VRTLIYVLLIACFPLLSSCHAFGEEAPPAAAAGKPTDPVGELFGLPVSMSNYRFVKSVIAIFGNKWGPQPKTPEEVDGVVWDQLLLSYEAFRRGIVVDQREFEEEVDKMMRDERVDFDWRKDTESYEEWVREKTGVPAGLFENQIKHLIQIGKLRERIMESVDSPVSDKEAYQEFLNEWNLLGIELVQFDTLKKATIFYRKTRRSSSFWDEEKEKKPDGFKYIRPVSLEFLMDLWRFQKKDVYKMMTMKEGSVYGPVPVFTGYAVCTVIGKRPADTSRYGELKEGYHRQMLRKKRFAGLARWFEDLKAQAKIKIYKETLPE
jgi:hypothetical protein